MAANEQDIEGITITDAARVLDLSAVRIRQLIQEGRLETRWTPYGRLILPDSLMREQQRRRKHA